MFLADMINTSWNVWYIATLFVIYSCGYACSCKDLTLEYTKNLLFRCILTNYKCDINTHHCPVISDLNRTLSDLLFYFLVWFSVLLVYWFPSSSIPSWFPYWVSHCRSPQSVSVSLSADLFSVHLFFLDYRKLYTQFRFKKKRLRHIISLISVLIYNIYCIYNYTWFILYWINQVSPCQTTSSFVIVFQMESNEFLVSVMIIDKKYAISPNRSYLPIKQNLPSSFSPHKSILCRSVEEKNIVQQPFIKYKLCEILIRPFRLMIQVLLNIVRI